MRGRGTRVLGGLDGFHWQHGAGLLVRVRERERERERGGRGQCGNGGALPSRGSLSV